MTKQFFFLVIMMMVIQSCQTSKTSDESVESDEWAAMDDFHMIMAESFHPFRDSSNLEPAKRHAGELVTAAEAWISSDRPSRMSSEEVDELLSDLKAEAENLNALVAGGSDQEIGASLTSLHDIFHHLQEQWYHKKE